MYFTVLLHQVHLSSLTACRDIQIRMLIILTKTAKLIILKRGESFFFFLLKKKKIKTRKPFKKCIALKFHKLQKKKKTKFTSPKRRRLSVKYIFCLVFFLNVYVYYVWLYLHFFFLKQQNNKT